MNKTLAVATIAIATGLFLGTFAIPQLGLNMQAIAARSEVLSFDTIPLEGMVLNTFGPENIEFILLVDSTPALIKSGHVALNVPCDTDGNTAIAVVAGVAPDVAPLALEYVAPLSNPGDSCTYHVTFPEGDQQITDVAIINTGYPVGFGSGHFVTTSVTTAGKP